MKPIVESDCREGPLEGSEIPASGERLTHLFLEATGWHSWGLTPGHSRRALRRAEPWGQRWPSTDHLPSSYTAGLWGPQECDAQELRSLHTAQEDGAALGVKMTVCHGLSPRVGEGCSRPARERHAGHRPREPGVVHSLICELESAICPSR